MTVAFLRSRARNPVALLISPIVVALTFGLFKLTTLQRDADVVLIQQSATPAAHQLASALGQVPHVKVTELASPSAARAKVKDGTDVALVQIPPGFGATAADGKLEPIRVNVVYGTDQSAPGVVSEVEAIVDQIDRQQQGTPQLLSVDAHFVASGNPLLGYLMPGMLSISVMMLAINLVVGVFAGYRKEGVLKRVRATGTPASSFVLAHATAVTLFTGLNVVITIVMASLLFGGLDLPALLVLSMLAFFSSLGIGLVVGGFIKDPERATGIGNAVGMPMYLLAFVPAGVLPAAVAAVVNLIPVGFLIHGIRLLFAGNDLWSVRTDILGLAIWAVVLLALASVTFRWEEQPA
jgi:ABC-2 type transport system permease protein